VLKLANYKETCWLEFKEGLVRDPQHTEFDKSNDTDIHWQVARALIALANTKGGAVVLGLDDSAEPVGLEKSDTGDKLKMGNDSFWQKVLKPALTPENLSWNCQKYGKHKMSSNVLSTLLEPRFLEYKEKKVALIIVKPLPIDSNLIYVIDASKKQEILPVRKLGEIGEVDEKFETEDKENYKKMRPSLLEEDCGPIYNRFLKGWEEKQKAENSKRSLK